MGMGLGERLRITLFGESHGKCVGALLQGIPPGTIIDQQALWENLKLRRPGRRGSSARSESDD